MQICTTSKKNKSPPVPIQSHQLNFIKIYGFGGGPGDPPVKEKSEPMHVPMALHIYHVLVTALKEILKPGEWFDEVFHHCMRIEFQGRGTVHIHIALWAIAKAGLELDGRTGNISLSGGVDRGVGEGNPPRRGGGWV